MSDLANFRVLGTSSSPQLPVHWYFDPQIHALEQRLLFEQGPGYVGHQLMVPNRGDFYALDWRDDARALIRNERGAELISNVCRHRQAIILKGRGNAKNIICPLHRWTYGLDGRLLGAPYFPDSPCLDLACTPLQSWNGMLFDSKRDIARDLAGLSVRHELDFSGFMLDRVQVDQYACNWKTFIEVYLEDYHVVPFHPGLGNFVSVDDLRWEFGDWHSVQTCGVKKGLARPGTPVYQKWHEALLRYNEGRDPPHGAIWLTYYPNIMVEWYPHALVISTIVARGPEACTNVIEFYYPEDIALFERSFIEAEQAAYEETAREDAEICERMTDGRRALYRSGRNEVGPYQSPMEDGMLHFHEFLRRELTPHL
ncbi:MAG TPA: aromatic ring-hydroxylating dioxygenase subunit alpha [Burkholderiales bacterium]|nr:aromatic ring-hydroxylating dioxygenase subunit alpha [Burkholderiales bacterium]